jgi:hypothetical protein
MVDETGKYNGQRAVEGQNKYLLHPDMDTVDRGYSRVIIE